MNYKLLYFITVRPVIDPFTFPKNLQEGMRSRLVCTVIQGDPPFAINWKKDDRPIEPGLGVIIRNDEFSSDLTFSSVTPRHNGNYTCIVSNAAASVSHTATLVVDGKFNRICWTEYLRHAEFIYKIKLSNIYKV